MEQIEFVDVFTFFIENNFDASDAQKFYNYYMMELNRNSIDNKILDWKLEAKLWVENNKKSL